MDSESFDYIKMCTCVLYRRNNNIFSSMLPIKEAFTHSPENNISIRKNYITFDYANGHQPCLGGDSERKRAASLGLIMSMAIKFRYRRK